MVQVRGDELGLGAGKCRCERVNKGFWCVQATGTSTSGHVKSNGVMRLALALAR